MPIKQAHNDIENKYLLLQLLKCPVCDQTIRDTCPVSVLGYNPTNSASQSVKTSTEISQGRIEQSGWVWRQLTWQDNVPWQVYNLKFLHKGWRQLTWRDNVPQQVVNLNFLCQRWRQLTWIPPFDNECFLGSELNLTFPCLPRYGWRWRKNG